MLASNIKSIVIAGALAMGVLSSTGASASSEFRGGIYFDSPGISIGFGNHDRGYRHRGWSRHRGWGRPRFDRNRCSPRRAVRKAHRRGIRRAHVIRVGHRGVVVAGRKWGERIVIGFGRSRSCPVRFVNAR